MMRKCREDHVTKRKKHSLPALLTLFLLLHRGGGVFLSSGRRRRAAYEPEEQRDAQVSVLSARTHRGANRRSAAHPLPVITEELKLWGVAAGLGLVHMITSMCQWRGNQGLKRVNSQRKSTVSVFAHECNQRVVESPRLSAGEVCVCECVCVSVYQRPWGSPAELPGGFLFLARSWTADSLDSGREERDLKAVVLPADIPDLVLDKELLLAALWLTADPDPQPKPLLGQH
ncbi:Phosphatidylinositol 345-trisphosphate-dependent Rac exchanger 1 protein [Dissostichus eleginoides]|uniref:Phosphatidylinositol 345-trisphosphate-dependent Rac exchanger 1 protein n=1 Tax=Dissostichus eleginoides TaxID=100907 RepID=A0AAD9CDC7_DISEL|nr:Phosphatidylinositol 345-trisphosphate-dependent Rac exchanger 1 protein [Dissostichus eleginoides]